AEDPNQTLATASAQRDVTELVADQQVGPLQLTQESVQRVLLLRLLQLADQLGRREEPHTQTGSTGSLSQGHSNMCFSSAVTSNKATIVLLFNPLASRQLQDLRLRQVRHHAEVVGVEVLQHRELGVLDPTGDRVGTASRQLGLGETEQELNEGLVGRGGVPCQLLELSAHRRQPQLSEMGL